jgi:hypothetical protein
VRDVGHQSIERVMGGPSAADALKILDAVVKAFDAGLDGTVTVDQAMA